VLIFVIIPSYTIQSGQFITISCCKISRGWYPRREETSAGWSPLVSPRQLLSRLRLGVGFLGFSTYVMSLPREASCLKESNRNASQGDSKVALPPLRTQCDGNLNRQVVKRFR
jgi:hypothetical protein